MAASPARRHIVCRRGVFHSSGACPRIPPARSDRRARRRVWWPLRDGVIPSCRLSPPRRCHRTSSTKLVPAVACSPRRSTPVNLVSAGAPSCLDSFLPSKMSMLTSAKLARHDALYRAEDTRTPAGSAGENLPPSLRSRRCFSAAFFRRRRVARNTAAALRTGLEQSARCTDRAAAAGGLGNGPEGGDASPAGRGQTRGGSGGAAETMTAHQSGAFLPSAPRPTPDGLMLE